MNLVELKERFKASMWGLVRRQNFWLRAGTEALHKEQSLLRKDLIHYSISDKRKLKRKHMPVHNPTLELDLNRVLTNLKVFEGFSAIPYVCPTGHLTIFYGRNLDQFPFTEEEAELWSIQKIVELRKSIIISMPWTASKSTEVKGVLIDMAYNLGLQGLLNFKKMLHALKNDEYALAAKELKDSKYFLQTGQRAAFHYNTLLTLEKEID